jgi:RNA polymerase sigma-70 factor (ECF subfamily)
MRSLSLDSHLAILTSQLRAATLPAWDRPGVERTLRSLWASARSAWPQVELAPEVFWRYLAARLPATATPDTLTGLHTSDLYLACACDAGQASAVAALDAALIAPMALSGLRRSAGAAAVDDVKQLLRQKLFVAEPACAPKIANYSGRGTLEGFVRAVAARDAVRWLRQSGQEFSGEDHGDETRLAGVAVDDLELEVLTREQREAFAGALREAVATLTGDLRMAVKLSAVDGCSVDEIGRILGVHRATAARHVEKGRRLLVRETHRRLRERLVLTPLELRSLIRAVRSRMDLSIRNALAG